MSSQLEQQASKALLGMSGQIGTVGIFPIVPDRIVASTIMKVGAYTIAAQPIAPSLLSVTVVTVSGADTMGTIVFVGTDINGAALTETVTPVSGSTVYTTNQFNSVTSATGVGWVIGTTADTITIGVADVVAPTDYYFSEIQVMSAAVVSSQTNLTGFLVAQLSDFTSIPVGKYPTKVTKIALTSGQAIGILQHV